MKKICLISFILTAIFGMLAPQEDLTNSIFGVLAMISAFVFLVSLTVIYLRWNKKRKAEDKIRKEIRKEEALKEYAEQLDCIEERLNATSEALDNITIKKEDN